MTEIRYYHLTKTPLERALPALLTVCKKRQWTSLVLCSQNEQVTSIDDFLWTFNDESFLPHARRDSGTLGRQPIWIAQEDEAIDESFDVLFLIGTSQVKSFKNYTLVCRLFSNEDTKTVEKVRGYWRYDKQQGDYLTYWQQEGLGWKTTAQENKPEPVDNLKTGDN